MKWSFRSIVLLAPAMLVLMLAVAPFASLPAAAQAAAPGTLVVSQAGMGRPFIEGAVTYFRVRSLGSKWKEQALSPLDAKDSKAFKLQPGDYEIVTHQQPCSGNCGQVDGRKVSECRAEFSLKPGDVLYALRIDRPEGNCTLEFGPTPPTGLLWSSDTSGRESAIFSGRVVAYSSTCRNGKADTSMILHADGSRGTPFEYIHVNVSLSCGTKLKFLTAESTPRRFHLSRDQGAMNVLEEFASSEGDTHIPAWNRLRGAEHEKIPFGQVVPSYRFVGLGGGDR